MDSIDSQIIMKELMNGPNKRGREDFENAIPDDLGTQNFQRGVGFSKFIKLAP